MYKSYLLIGAGGSGMSPLGFILLEKGMKVYGVDKGRSSSFQKLMDQGMVEINDFRQIQDLNIDFAVYSSAIDKESNEFYRASTKNCKMLHRSELMHELFMDIKTIAVAGSHGKTTTTAMIAFLMKKMEMNPQVMIGGNVSFLNGTGGCFGKGEYGVCESDESDGSFISNPANIKIVTNIDDDHLDYYKTKKNLFSSFVEFITKGRHSQVVTDLDDAGVREILPDIIKKGYGNIIGITRNTESYPFPSIRYRIENDILVFINGNQEYSISLQFPGDHYLKNAFLSIVALNYFAIGFIDSVKHIQQYPGVNRRLEKIGSYNGAHVYDDYGHHPSEVRAVLSSARKMIQKNGKGRSVILFQPHRYTRTRDHYLAFAQELKNCEQLFILPIYSAGENPIPGINSELIFSEVIHGNKVLLTGNLESDIEKIRHILLKDDILITLGAGDVRTWGETLVNI